MVTNPLTATRLWCFLAPYFTSAGESKITFILSHIGKTSLQKSHAHLMLLTFFTPVSAVFLMLAPTPSQGPLLCSDSNYCQVTCIPPNSAPWIDRGFYYFFGTVLEGWAVCNKMNNLQIRQQNLQFWNSSCNKCSDCWRHMWYHSIPFGECAREFYQYKGNSWGTQSGDRLLYCVKVIRINKHRYVVSIYMFFNMSKYVDIYTFGAFFYRFSSLHSLWVTSSHMKLAI